MNIVRNRGGLGLVVAACILVMAGRVHADSGPMRIGRVELYPTWSAVGVEVSFAGDDARQTEPSLKWRRAGEKPWRNGVEMTVDRDKRYLWASIWPLEQGEAIDVRIDFADPRGEAPAAFEGTTSTKVMMLDPPAGATRYYVSPDGNDFKPGTRQRPFRTLRHASSVVRAGEVIVARGGVYREGDLFSRLQGTPGAPIVIMAAEGEQPILDGALEIPAGATGWSELGDGLHVMALPAPSTELKYVAISGERLYPYRSLEAGRQDTHTTSWGDTYQIERGWFFDASAGLLYVRLRDGSKPADTAFQVALHDYGALLAGSRHVVLRGFEIRNYGHACVRISEGATGCLVYSNDLHNAQAGVFVYGEETAANAVWHNRIHEPGLARYSWGQNKGSGNQRQGITGWAGSERGRMGRGNSFCHNDIRGWFDGIMPGGWNRTDRLDLSRDMDIMYNTISDIGDDAIEVDSGAVNQRVHGNTVRNVFAAFAAAAIEKGPVYFTRNTATFYVLGFKLNVGGPESLGAGYFYHNALYCLSSGNSYGGTGISFPNGPTMPIANKVFMNNALIVDGMGIRYGQAGSVFDYNHYVPIPGGEPVSFRWDYARESNTWETATYESMDALAAATGQERHGLNADPQFVATPGVGAFARGDYGPLPFTAMLEAARSEGADFRLQAGSPCIDAGVVIRGINEEFLGAAPDVGAFESAGE